MLKHLCRLRGNSQDTVDNDRGACKCCMNSWHLRTVRNVTTSVAGRACEPMVWFGPLCTTEIQSCRRMGALPHHCFAQGARGAGPGGRSRPPPRAHNGGLQRFHAVQAVEHHPLGVEVDVALRPARRALAGPVQVVPAGSQRVHRRVEVLRGLAGLPNNMQLSTGDHKAAAPPMCVVSGNSRVYAGVAGMARRLADG